MATGPEWSKGYARQADADFNTFQILQRLSIPECHKLQFLQMACEKLTKAHLCSHGADATDLPRSHAYVANTLPVVLRQYMILFNFEAAAARKANIHAKYLCQEIDLLAPAVKRGGQRPDNCEYPWADDIGKLHVPLDWTFSPSQLLLEPGCRNFLKLVHAAIEQLL